MSTERDLIKEAYSKEGAWGISTAIDIHGCNPAKIQDEATINRFIYELCDFIKMKRYGDCIVVRFGRGGHDRVLRGSVNRDIPHICALCGRYL